MDAGRFAHLLDQLAQDAAADAWQAAAQAIMTISVVDGAWKITGLEVLEEKRVDPYAASQTQPAG